MIVQQQCILTIHLVQEPGPFHPGHNTTIAGKVPQCTVVDLGRGKDHWNFAAESEEIIPSHT